jgi:hypothetical protein
LLGGGEVGSGFREGGGLAAAGFDAGPDGEDGLVGYFQVEEGIAEGRGEVASNVEGGVFGDGGFEVGEGAAEFDGA